MNKINYIPPENNKGCCEYKLKLIFTPEEVREKKKIKIASQMKYRLFQGNGKAIYIIGIDDDGTNKGIKLKELFDSIHFFIDASRIINAKIKSIKINISNITFFISF